MNQLQKLLFGKKNVELLQQAKALVDRSFLKGSYTIVGGQMVGITDNATHYIEDGYSVNDVVYAIVNLILDKIRVAPWGLYQVKDESSLKAYQGIIRKKKLSSDDVKLAMNYRSKALEPITNANLSVGKLIELLKWPNESETFPDFVANGCGYKLLTGNKMVWANLLDMGANKGIPDELQTLPSQAVTITATRGFPSRVINYSLGFLKIDYNREDILHEKYWNPNWSISGNELYGMSPLKAALKTLTRNNSSIDASSSKFQNNGLEAIIYVDDPKMPTGAAEAQANALKAKLVSEYTGPKNMGKIAASGYKVGVANLGLSPAELGILEIEKWDAIKLCNVFGVPPELMGLTQKTYNNIVEAEKALTTRSALPLLTSFRDNLNRKLQTDWGFKGKNIYVDMDMSVYTELNDDMKELAEWTSKLWYLPPNRALELMGLERIDNPLFDEPWIDSSSRVPLSEHSPNALDQNIDDDQE